MAAFLEFEISALDLKTFLTDPNVGFAGLKITFDVNEPPHKLNFENLSTGELYQGNTKTYRPHYDVGSFPQNLEDQVTLQKKDNAYEILNHGPSWQLIQTERIAFTNLITKFDFAIFTADTMTNILSLKKLTSVTFFGVSFSLGLNDKFKDAIPYKPYFTLGLTANVDTNIQNFQGITIGSMLDKPEPLIYLADVCPPGWR